MVNQDQLFDKYSDNILGLEETGVIITATSRYQAGQTIRQNGKDYTIQQEVFEGERLLLIGSIAVSESRAANQSPERVILDRKTSSKPFIKKDDIKVCIIFEAKFNSPNGTGNGARVTYFDYSAYDIDVVSARDDGFYYPELDSFWEYHTLRVTEPSGSFAETLPDIGPNSGFDVVPSPEHVSCQASRAFPRHSDVVNPSSGFVGFSACTASSTYNFFNIGVSSWSPNFCTIDGDVDCCHWPVPLFHDKAIPYNSVVDPPIPERQTGTARSASFWYVESGACSGPPIIDPGGEANGFVRIFPGNIYKCIGQPESWAYATTEAPHLCDAAPAVPLPKATHTQTSNFTGEILHDGTFTGVVLPGSEPFFNPFKVARDCTLSSNWDNSSCPPTYTIPTGNARELRPNVFSPIFEYYAYWNGKVFKFPKTFRGVDDFYNPYSSNMSFLFNDEDAAYYYVQGGGEVFPLDSTFNTVELAREAHQPFLLTVFKIDDRGISIIYENDKLNDGLIAHGSLVAPSLESKVPYPNFQLSPYSFYTSTLEGLELTGGSTSSTVFNWSDLWGSDATPAASSAQVTANKLLGGTCAGYSTDGESLIYIDSSQHPGIYQPQGNQSAIFTDGIQLKYGFLPITDINLDNFSELNPLEDNKKSKTIRVPPLLELLPDTDTSTLEGYADNQFVHLKVINISINDKT